MTRKFLSIAVLLVIGALVITNVSGPSLGQGKKGKRTGTPYVHTVIFYLKKDLPKGTTSALIKDSHKLLGSIPSVRLLRVGRPAEKATPEYALKNYSFGLTILFDDFKGLETYLVHKQHLQYVKKHQDKFEKVLVYDYSNQRK